MIGDLATRTYNLIGQSSDSGDTPIGLIYMAALLLKHGFIAFADLLPFVRPLILP